MSLNITKVISATGLTLAVSLSLSGCALLPGNELSRTSSAHQNGKVLSDDRGSWNQVELQSDYAIFLEENQSTGVPVGVTTKLTTADMHSATNWVLKFVSSEGIDSIAVDSTAGWELWKKTEAAKYIDKRYMKAVLATPVNKNTISFGIADRPEVIMNNQADRMSGFLTRGGQRVRTIGFDGPVSAVASEKDAQAVTVSGTIYANYSTLDDPVKRSFLEQQPIFTEEDLKVAVPVLFDNNPGRGELSMNFAYTVIKQADGGWKIIDYENYFIYSSITNE